MFRGRASGWVMLPPCVGAFARCLASMASLADGDEVGRVVDATSCDVVDVVDFVGGGAASLAGVPVSLEDGEPELAPLGGGGSWVALAPGHGATCPIKCAWAQGYGEQSCSFGSEHQSDAAGLRLQDHSAYAVS